MKKLFNKLPKDISIKITWEFVENIWNTRQVRYWRRKIRKMF